MADHNPGREQQRLMEVYAEMTDGELEKLAGEASTLSDVAREALSKELSKRKLHVELQTAASAKEREEDGHPALVTVRKFLNVSEALFAKSLLDSAGIECFLGDENMIRLDWFLSNALGGIKLLVRQEDAGTAATLLDQKRPEPIDVHGVGEYSQPLCPKCHSTDVSFKPLKRRAAYASIAVGFPIPFKHIAWKCRNCGHIWDEPTGDTR